jgi:hypothetical protein
MSAPDVDPTCGATTDIDCTDSTVTPGDGVGPLMVINANLIMGNAADSGSGGGLRFQGVNGVDVTTFPNGNTTVTRPIFTATGTGTQSTPVWYEPIVTNNIIANNVAGWDGGGVSLNDALAVRFVNNTVVSNDTTASSGVLFNTLFAPLASSQGPSCIQNGTSNAQSCPQPAGLVSTPNSVVLTNNLATNVTCPAGTGTGGILNGACRYISYPILDNNIFWQNRSFVIAVGGTQGQLQTYQQNVVTLYDASFTGAATTPAPTQPQADAATADGSGVRVTGGTGACVSPVSYWDIGVRGDTGPNNHVVLGGAPRTLAPLFSVLTSTTGYAASNTAVDPTLISEYCNGSRTPPELGSSGFLVPPGTNEGNAPLPYFTLLPSATTDESNNWINMRWGPLAMTNISNGSRNGTTLGNYGLTSTSTSAIGRTPSTQTGTTGAYTLAPATDFFGNARKTNNAVDAGAVEFVSAAPTLVSISPATGAAGTNTSVTLMGANLLGTTAVNVSGTGITVSGITVVDPTHVTATFTIANTATAGARTVSVTTPLGTSNTVTFTVTATPGTLTYTSATNGTLATIAGTRTLTFTIPGSRPGVVTSVVTATNTGTGPLQITAENLTNNGGGAYILTATTCSFTTPLAAGGTCTISVTYQVPPTQPPSNILGTLSVPNNGLVTPRVLNLVAR